MELMEHVPAGDEPLGFVEVNYRSAEGKVILRFHDDGKVWCLDRRGVGGRPFEIRVEDILKLNPSN